MLSTRYLLLHRTRFLETKRTRLWEVWMWGHISALFCALVVEANIIIYYLCMGGHFCARKKLSQCDSSTSPHLSYRSCRRLERRVEFSVRFFSRIALPRTAQGLFYLVRAFRWWESSRFIFCDWRIAQSNYTTHTGVGVLVLCHKVFHARHLLQLVNQSTKRPEGWRSDCIRWADRRGSVYSTETIGSYYGRGFRSVQSDTSESKPLCILWL